MKAPVEPSLAEASRFYSRIIRLYPKEHRRQFGAQMRLTFEDSYRHAAGSGGRVPAGFWVAVIWDEARSIVREHVAGDERRRHIDQLVVGLLLSWPLLAFVLPGLVPRHLPLVLLAPAALLAALFLASPGLSGSKSKAITVAVSIAGVSALFGIGRSLHDVPDVLGPGLLIVCLLFLAKAVSGWHSSTLDARSPAWTRAELTYGMPLAVAGALGIAFGSVALPDNDQAIYLVSFGLVLPLCLATGYAIGRRPRSITAGLGSALSVLMLAAATWMLARAGLAALAAYPGLLGVDTLLATDLSGWQRTASALLTLDSLFVMAGAVVGQLLRDEVEVPGIDPQQGPAA